MLGILPLLTLPQLVSKPPDLTLSARYIQSELTKTIPKPQFPNMLANYQNTVVIPAQEAAQAAEAAQEQEVAAEQAQAAYVAPAPVYAAPSGDAKAFIYAHESGNDPGSINRSSGACGLGQALPCSKMPCSLSDYACQDNFFTGYMLSRYGSWEAARAFWINHSWW